MRATTMLGGLLLAATLLDPVPGRTAPPERPAFGVDHLLHEGKVNITGAKPIPCASCHPIDAKGALVGVPGHKSCFGACHKAPPGRQSPASQRKLAQAERRVCTRCHTPASITRWQAGSRARLKPFYPPYSIQPDYGIQMSHSKHEAPSRAAGRKTTGCRTCHGIPRANAKKPRATQGPHGRCSMCHAAPAKGVPSMKDCTACHRAAYGPASRPTLVTGAFSVGSTFDHRQHLGRLGPKQDCRTCHSGITTVSATDLPAPKTRDCASCHDGAKAFSTTGPSCRKCHTLRATKRQRTQVSRKRFSHAQHARRGMKQTCADCHTLGQRGQPNTASRDHRPCSDSGCHRAEFAKAKPQICGSCHIAVEPWRALHHDRAPRTVTEFGARFSHDKHLGGRSPRISADCASCHRRRAATREMALRRGHADCASAGCHGQKSGAKPHLAQCTGCHALGILGQRARTRSVAKWSVRARFRHRPHTADPRAKGRALACTTCHQQMRTARGVAGAPTPAKASCVGCHDGAVAFKTTGHDCWRCHSQK